MIADSDNIVFFGGAGVSTESGIPDFRSENGLYRQKYKYPPETILSHEFFITHPEDFFEFYRKKLASSKAQPNAAHIRLVELENEGKLKAVITQNVDGLHRTAGSKKVLELHGNASKCYCSKCHRPYPDGYLDHGEGVPKCACGGVLRPDVVLYGETLDQSVISESIEYIKNADLLIVGGTSLVVYPAAGFLNYYRGDKLVLINRSKTIRDDDAALVIHKKIGEVFSQI